jgi:predicted Zn-dependent protease with MMP-like domain
MEDGLHLPGAWRLIASARMSRIWLRLLRAAQEEVQDTLRRLPTPLRHRARALPVTYEHRPSPELEEDGIAPDTLGLFVGEELAETGATAAPLPAQIILYLDNLWDYADSDEQDYLDEVRATYLHELGHYLGLGEIDLEQRGLG